MKIDFLPEPELEFGNSGRHIDIRFGMMQHKPLDYDTKDAPKKIQIGLIGTSETIEGMETWLEKCRKGIESKKSKQPYLFPEFPGFGEDDNLPMSISFDDRRNATIPNKEIDKLLECKDRNVLVLKNCRAFCRGTSLH